MPGARAFLIVLDREGLSIGPMVKAREAAAAFVRSLGPADRAGLIGIPGASPFVDPTRDKERVAAALERPVAPAGEEMSGGIMRVRVSVAEAVQIAFRDGATLAAAISRECHQEVQPDQAFRIAESGGGCPWEVLVEAQRTEMLSRDKAVGTVRALRGIVESLGKLDVPKRIVLVSPGFRGGRELTSELEALAEAAATARVTIDTIQPSAPRFEMSDARPAPDWVAESWTLAEGPGRIAELTGGAFLRSMANPRPAFERLSRERSGYYLLALEPRDADRDGKPHAIEVKVRHPGATVRARAQFVIGGRASNADRAEMIRALLASPLGVDEVPVEAGTYVLHGEGDQLAVIAEVAVGPSLPSAAATLAFALTDESGRVVTSGERGLDAPARPDEPARASFTFAVAPGTYSLRLAVADDRGRPGALEHPVSARLVERDGRRVSDLLLGDPSAPRGGQLRPFPTTTIDQVSALLEMDDTGTDEPAVSFEVAATEGGPPLIRAAATVTREAGRATADALVPLGPLTAGEYVLRASVGGTAVVSRRFRYAPKPQGPSAAASVSQGGGKEPASGLMQRVDAYVADYAHRLGAVIAREDYLQREYSEDGQRAERHLVSDVLMARLPGHPWVAYRDVAEVEGKAVRDRAKRLERLLKEEPGSALEQAGRLADEGARYNLGRYRRNFNMPTLALALLDPAVRERVALARLDDKEVGGRRLAQLRVRERQAGVLVHTLRGEPVRSEAVFGVDPNTGAIVRSHVVVDHEDVRATIDVEFGEVPSLGLPAPVEMREDYRRPPSSRADVLLGKYRVDGVATYRDYVRPQVDVEVLGARVATP